MVKIVDRRAASPFLDRPRSSLVPFLLARPRSSLVPVPRSPNAARYPSLRLAASSPTHVAHLGGLPPATGRKGTRRPPSPHREHGPSHTLAPSLQRVSLRSSVSTQPRRVSGKYSRALATDDDFDLGAPDGSAGGRGGRATGWREGCPRVARGWCPRGCLAESTSRSGRRSRRPRRRHATRQTRRPSRSRTRRRRGRSPRSCSATGSGGRSRTSSTWTVPAGEAAGPGPCADPPRRRRKSCEP